MNNEPVKQKRQIQGKVAGVLNERELVINVGSNSGVQKGMKFAVFANEETKLYDPETGDLLGIIDREKVRVRATEVKEKLSICRTYRELTIGGGPLREYVESQGYLGLSHLFDLPRRVPETLRVDKSAYLPPLSEEESYVKIGDRVVQVPEDD
jgi:hypothetical protein